jgi:hypothetical protein
MEETWLVAHLKLHVRSDLGKPHLHKSADVAHELISANQKWIKPLLVTQNSNRSAASVLANIFRTSQFLAESAVCSLEGGPSIPQRIARFDFESDLISTDAKKSSTTRHVVQRRDDV